MRRFPKLVIISLLAVPVLTTACTGGGNDVEAIERLSNHITTWLNKYRPLEANIIEGAAVKKDKQKEVYIDLGSSEGAFVGLHMGVFVVKTIAGREAKSQIGKLKIEAVEGDDISLCKVQSGGKRGRKHLHRHLRIV